MARVSIIIIVSDNMMIPQTCAFPNLWNVDCVFFHGKRDFTDITKPETLKGEFILDICVPPV